MTGIETTGTVDEDHRLRLDEDEWLRAAARNPEFRDLEAPEEDVYSLEDGDPFLDQT